MPREYYHIINGLTADGLPFEGYIEDGVFIESPDPGKTYTFIDAGGWLVLPGLVDMHVHFRDPWALDDSDQGECIESGALAALNGGVTSCACMPNTIPAIDSPEALQYVIEKSNEAGCAKVYPIAALTTGRHGKELVDFEILLDNGAAAFSDDGSTLMDPDLMKRALEVSSDLGFTVIAHSLDETGYEGWVFHEGTVHERYNVPGIPSSAESDIVQRDIDFALQTGGRLHIAHVSCAETLEYIAKGKEAGGRISCEVSPHHLVFCEDDIQGDNPVQFKVSPPLRSGRDREALWEGLSTGVIDVIASDHAPHPPSSKHDLLSAKCGMTGIETMLFSVLFELAEREIMTVQDAVEKMTKAPAWLLDIDAGSLDAGRPADLIILNPDVRWECTEDYYKSQSLNTPFTGNILQGVISHVFVDGVLHTW